jgi:hypothetical protein
VLFALVANRALEPSSKLAATRWVAERVAICGCPALDDDAADAAMDFLADALGEIAEQIFAATANLLNLSCEVIFVDTTSTSLEVDVADAEVELATAQAGGAGSRQPPDADGLAPGPSRPPGVGSPSTPRTTGPTCPRW